MEPRQKPRLSKQDYSTPKPFVQACERRWGRFTIDLAAHSSNAKAPRFITPEEDSLAVRWPTEGLAWLNPPFGDIGRWAAKCAAQVTFESALRIVMLTPASIGTDWFAEHVHGEALVLGIRPRLKFEGMDDPYPKDLMLSLYGFGVVGFDVWKWDAQ